MRITPDFQDQTWPNLGISDTHTVLLLKSTGKQYAQTELEAQEVNIIKNEEKKYLQYCLDALPRHSGRHGSIFRKKE